LPEALVNFVAFLGWNPKTEQEIFTLDALIKEFDLAKINKSGAVFDVNKLDWMNAEYIRTKSNAELVELCKPYWQEAGVVVGGASEKNNTQYLEAIVGLEKDRLKKLSEIAERTSYFFTDPTYDAEMLIWKKADAAQTKQSLALLSDLVRVLDDEILTSIPKLEEKVKAFIVEHELDNGTVLWPLRVAMTGMEKSPNPFEVTAVLALGKGREEVARRLESAILKLA
jgi:glutamyl/glutaminyl-tRNA synthetase